MCRAGFVWIYKYIVVVMPQWIWQFIGNRGQPAPTLNSQPHITKNSMCGYLHTFCPGRQAHFLQDILETYFDFRKCACPIFITTATSYFT